MTEIKSKLDKRGKFFCPAKWEESHLYLDHGTTSSCHHPIPHPIPLDELKTNVFALHNTSQKLDVQRQMLNNEIPKECIMCSHLEAKGIRSDRFIKGYLWEKSIDSLQVSKTHIPKLIHIAFDNLCNLNCSYCDSGRSSSWASILHKTGSFKLKSDKRNLYNAIHIKPNSTKPEFLEAWNAWWDIIKNDIETLKFSGGEPLLSPNFWNFVEKFRDNKNLNLNVEFNSNLIVQEKYLEKISEYAPFVKELFLTASIDCKGEMAEFARGGFNYEVFIRNIHKWAKESPDNCYFSLQSTINVFNIWNITDFFDLHLELKQMYPNKIRRFYSGLVKTPEFQNILVLPKFLRDIIYEKIKIWHNNNIEKFEENEKILINKSFEYLINEQDDNNKEKKEIYKNDLRKFIINYEPFAKHKFEDIYPIEFVDWLKNP